MQSILVVDDDPEIREIVADILGAEATRHVQVANSAEAAIECMRSREFDLVITDGQMPGRSGLELIAMLRQSESRASLVFMSGSPMLRSRAILAGANSVLAKPFHSHQLVALVGSLLSLDDCNSEHLQSPT